MIELCRRQLNFADGLIAEEVSDLWEDWMRHVDDVLADAQLVNVVYAALSTRWPHSRTRGRKGTPAEVVFFRTPAAWRTLGGRERETQRTG